MPASTLVGPPMDDVIRLLGQPSQKEGCRWTFNTPAGTLRVYTNAEGRIVDAQPGDFDALEGASERLATGTDGVRCTRSPTRITAAIARSDRRWLHAITASTEGVRARDARWCSGERAARNRQNPIGDFLSARLATPQVIFYSADVTVALLVPNSSYADALQEAMRKGEAPESVPVPSVFKVAVSPSNLRSPDIIKIIVERDSKTVPPVEESLAPTELTTAAGAKFVVHRGTVSYPCAAFLSGATVKVT